MKKLKKGIDKGINLVATKSKEIVDTTLVKKEIADLEEEKHLTFQALGQIVYKMYQENTDEEATIKEKCQIIKDLDEKIAVKEAELKKIFQEAQEALGKSVCASCGTVVDEESKFCGNCGARIDKVE